MFFHQISLVLRLKINTPFIDQKLEFLFLIWIGVFQNVNGFRIRQPMKIIFGDELQSVKQAQFAALFFWFAIFLLLRPLI
jgi:hypothetical protein